MIFLCGGSMYRRVFYAVGARVDEDKCCDLCGSE